MDAFLHAFDATCGSCRQYSLPQPKLRPHQQCGPPSHHHSKFVNNFARSREVAPPARFVSWEFMGGKKAESGKEREAKKQQEAAAKAAKEKGDGW
eukprot:1160987-Pelagomonas_calceolata.AAC.7